MLVLVRMCENKLCDGMTMPGLEHSKDDLCMFRKASDGVSEMVDVCHVDGSFARECFNDRGGAGVRRFRRRGGHQNNPFQE